MTSSNASLMVFPPSIPESIFLAMSDLNLSSFSPSRSPNLSPRMFDTTRFAAAPNTPLRSLSSFIAPDSFATSEKRLMASSPLRLPNSPLESCATAIFSRPMFSTDDRFRSFSIARIRSSDV